MDPFQTLIFITIQYGDWGVKGTLSDLQVKGEFAYHTANAWQSSWSQSPYKCAGKYTTEKSSMWHKVMIINVELDF